MRTADIIPCLPRLNRYALCLTRNRVNAQDLVQNAILVAIEKLGAGELFIAHPAAWLCGIMRYEWLSQGTLSRRMTEVEYEDWEHSEPPEQDGIALRIDLEKFFSAQRPCNQHTIREVLLGNDYAKGLTGGKALIKHLKKELAA